MRISNVIGLLENRVARIMYTIGPKKNINEPAHSSAIVFKYTIGLWFQLIPQSRLLPKFGTILKMIHFYIEFRGPIAFWYSFCVPLMIDTYILCSTVLLIS